MSCTECKFAVFQDTGYSNWTVMGTDFYCAKKVHPNDGFDLFYGQAPGLEFGQTCTEKEEGEPLSLDVDGESQLYFSDDERLMWEIYCKN